MKFQHILKNSLLALCLVLAGSLFNACEKDIELTDLQAIVPTNLDVAGGTWKTYILTKPDEVALDAPKASNSTEYQAELTELKSLSANLTAAQ